MKNAYQILWENIEKISLNNNRNFGNYYELLTMNNPHKGLCCGLTHMWVLAILGNYFHGFRDIMYILTREGEIDDTTLKKKILPFLDGLLLYQNTTCISLSKEIPQYYEASRYFMPQDTLGNEPTNLSPLPRIYHRPWCDTSDHIDFIFPTFLHAIKYSLQNVPFVVTLESEHHIIAATIYKENVVYFNANFLFNNIIYGAISRRGAKIFNLFPWDIIHEEGNDSLSLDVSVYIHWTDKNIVSREEYPYNLNAIITLLDLDNFRINKYLSIYSFMYIVIRYNHTDILEKLLEHKGSELANISKKGISLLSLAYAYGSIESVELLLRYRADPYSIGSQTVAKYGNKETIDLLNFYKQCEIKFEERRDPHRSNLPQIRHVRNLFPDSRTNVKPPIRLPDIHVPSHFSPHHHCNQNHHTFTQTTLPPLPPIFPRRRKE